MTNPFGKNTGKQIFISTTHQLSDTNRTSIKNLSLLVTTIGQKELAIGSVLLGDNIDVEANQDIASIYRYLHGDWYFPFGSWKSGNKIIVDFG